MSDLTSIPTDEGWLFLASVIDLASRHLLGWSMGERHDATLVIESRRASDLLLRELIKGARIPGTAQPGRVARRSSRVTAVPPPGASAICSRPLCASMIRAVR